MSLQAGREDEEACAKLQFEVQQFQEECSKDLEAAEPIIAEAEAALNSLDKVGRAYMYLLGVNAAC